MISYLLKRESKNLSKVIPFSRGFFKIILGQTERLTLLS